MYIYQAKFNIVLVFCVDFVNTKSLSSFFNTSTSYVKYTYFWFLLKHQIPVMSKLTKTKSSFDGVDEAAMEVGQAIPSIGSPNADHFHIGRGIDVGCDTVSISDLSTAECVEYWVVLVCYLLSPAR